MGLLRVNLSRFAITFISLLLPFGLGSCHHYYDNSVIFTQDTRFKLPKRVYGTSDTRVIKKIRALNQGRIVKVASIGSDYLISIPSSALFPDQSPELTWKSYALLNQVVSLMKEFRKISVNVTSYSSQYVSVRREQALTLARSRAVGEYLWSQGINSRFIFTEGAGSDKPISNYIHGGDHSPSSRVEIIFRDTIV